jgi:hypothetical protein
VLPPRSASQILSEEDKVAGCPIAAFNEVPRYCRVHGMTKGVRVTWVTAPKMDEVVCAHNLF